MGVCVGGCVVINPTPISSWRPGEWCNRRNRAMASQARNCVGLSSGHHLMVPLNPPLACAPAEHL